jgi:Cft2 family RNA processing exonuclease
LAYVQFLAAAGTVTGSAHLISIDDFLGKSGFQVLIDCGLFQGAKEGREHNWRDTPIPAKEIDAVVLTHVHVDQCGWIHRLVKEGSVGRSMPRPRPLICAESAFLTRTLPTQETLCCSRISGAGHARLYDQEQGERSEDSRRLRASSRPDRGA